MKKTNLLLAGLLVLFFWGGAFYHLSHPERPAPPPAVPQEPPLPDRLVFSTWSDQGQLQVVENLDGTGQYVLLLFDPNRSHYDQVGTRGQLSPEEVAALGDYLTRADLSPEGGPEAPPGQAQGYFRLRYKTTHVNQSVDAARLQSLLENAPAIGEAYRKGPILKPPRHSAQE